MKKNSLLIILWIVGLLCPIVGIILYFMWKKNYRNRSNIVLKSSICGFIIYLFLILIFGTKSSIDFDNRDVSQWYSDVSSGKQVVTILGLTTCSHCQEYKPVITALAKKHNFNLYFYEIDALSEEERDTLMNSFELKDYDGHVPYTFIFNKGEYLSGTVGFSNRDNTIKYLKENNIIKGE